MNPNDPSEQNTIPGHYAQFPTYPSQEFQDLSQFSQSRSLVPVLVAPQYSSPRPQWPQTLVWQWYLGRSNKQKLAIGCGVLASLLLLGGIVGTIFGAMANAGVSRQQPQTEAVRAAFPVPTSMPTPTPTDTPTPKSTPTPTPTPVQKVNVTVSSQMVKKVSGKYRYLFDIRNQDSKSFKGSATISLYNNQQQTPLGQDTFDMTQPLQPSLGGVVYFDISTGPISQQGAYGITHFKYTIMLDGQEVNTGEGQIANKYEDTSLF